MPTPPLVYRTPRKEPCEYKLPWRATYSPFVAERICDEVASGRTLDRIAIEEPWAPSARQMRYWLNEHPDFKATYHDAMHMRAEKAAQEILEVADDLTVDPEDRKIMIAARQWLAGKLNPRDWGERKILEQNINATVKAVQELDVSHLSMPELHAARMALASIVDVVEGSNEDDDTD
jgi:hypothetical protein